MSGDRASAQLLDEMKQLHPMLIDLSLDRIEDLLEKLDAPHRRLPPVVHVAGTNGKGSTCAYFVAMLQAAGLRVHCYTSPHLVRFHERIALAGADGVTAPIGEAELVELLQRVRDANGSAPMTFFEMTTAAAFLAFAERPADAVVLEVGLGGRLDATNLVDRPAVTVITPVAMDHADKLGETIAAIAFEKAGIIKAGRPCVVGPQVADAMTVITRVADGVGAPLIQWGQSFDAFAQSGRLVYQEGGALLDLPLPALRGPHQVINAGVAVAAMRALAGEDDRFAVVDEAAMAEGLVSVQWPARMMSLSNGPLARLVGPDDELWLDGGHNPAAGAVIAQSLADLEDKASRQTFLICGMMGQKDARGFLEPFLGLVRGIVTVPVTGGMGEATDPRVLAELAQDLGFQASVSANVETALRELALTVAGPKRVLICGSLYLAGSVLAHEQGVAAEPN